MNIILCAVAASILVNVVLSDTPEQKLKSVQEKLQGVKTTLDALKNQSTSSESTSSYNFQTYITLALEHVGELNTAVDALNLDYHIGVIKNLDPIHFDVRSRADNSRRLASELYTAIRNIGNNTHAASDPEKAKELQQSALSAVGELNIILKNLQDDLRKGKTLEQGNSEAGKGKTVEQGKSEAEKNTPTEKLKHIQEKLKVVKTKLGDLKKESNFGDEVTMLMSHQEYFGQKSFDDNIVNSLRHAGQLSKAVDAALKVEEKDIDIKKLRSLARSLYKDTEQIGRYTEYAKDPEKARKLLQSAFSAVGETLRDIEPDLSTPKQKMKSVQEKLQGVKTTLDALKNQSTSNQSTSSYNFQTAITWALGHVDELNTVVDALNSDYHIDVIKNARRLANELYHWIEKIGNYTHAASDPGKAKELQQSASSAVGEISIILNNLQDDLRKGKTLEQGNSEAGKGKTLEQGNSEAEKNMPKEKLKHIQEKLQVVKTKLGNLKSEGNPKSVSFLRYTNFALEAADDFNKVLDGATVQVKELDIKKLNFWTGELRRNIENIGKYTGHATNPGKAKDLQHSAFSDVEEISKTLDGLHV